MALKRLLFASLILIFFLSMISCTSYMDKYYQGSKKAHFYHGQKLQDRFVSILSYTPEKIEFKIRRGPRSKYFYHITVDEEEERISEGWFPAYKVQGEHYTLKTKAKKGYSFQLGKKYRLCVGFSNPDLVYIYSNNYKCFVDYEFVLPYK